LSNLPNDPFLNISINSFAKKFKKSKTKDSFIKTRYLKTRFWQNLDLKLFY